MDVPPQSYTDAQVIRALEQTDGHLVRLVFLHVGPLFTSCL